MIYAFEKDEKHNVIKIFVHGTVIKVAEFMLEDETDGKEAFRTFCAGIAASGNGLTNRRTGQFMIGTLDQLLHDELK